MEINTKANLQFFADAGTLVNGTAGYVNAGTGAVTEFDAGNTLAPELKAFYDTELLENARFTDVRVRTDGPMGGADRVFFTAIRGN